MGHARAALLWIGVPVLVLAGCDTDSGRQTSAADTDTPDSNSASRPRTGRPQSDGDGEQAGPPADRSGTGRAHAARPSAVGPQTGIDPRGSFFGEPDYPRRHALATAPIADIDKGSGGRSLGFEIRLRDGTKGYYKPEQKFSGQHWYAELAAYYLDRELGLGRVPPAVGRRLAWAPLRRVAAGDERVEEVVVQDDGTVRGAFIWWIPEDLEPISPGWGWETWVRQGGGLEITPYQRPARWRAQLRARSEPGPEAAAVLSAHKKGRRPAGEPARPGLPAELSDLILFDYLTRNIDRWGGHFTNVRTRGRGGPVIYLDNGAGFAPGDHRTGLVDHRLHVLERFRSRTVAAIRKLDLESLKRRMATDPLAPVLDAHRLQGIAVRRRHLLEHVDDVCERYGRDAAMGW